LESFLDQLAIYLEDGNSRILNAEPSGKEELPRWHDENKNWQKKVEDYLEQNFGLRERNSFKHIVVLEYKLQGGIDSEHFKHRNILAWKLLAIKEIILRYSERAARWRAENI
jgi:hypothetical protein